MSKEDTKRHFAEICETIWSKIEHQERLEKATAEKMRQIVANMVRYASKSLRSGKQNSGLRSPVIDAYSKVAFAKLYDRKNALVAADMLNDRAIPFFDSKENEILDCL